MPRNRTGFVISALVMLMAAVAHPAGAGTIDVGGTVTFPGLIIDLVGNRGFTANGLPAHWFRAWGRRALRVCQASPSTCPRRSALRTSSVLIVARPP
jgi:hypothetical protein